ncbi:MAG TPA: extracellular solute-binding protein [Firmicutes bacterium]|nr:extracellular solute-binding protein [Bacillota bacterium]
MCMRYVAGMVLFVLMLTSALSLTCAAAEQVTITMILFNREEEAKWQQAVLDMFHKQQDRIRVELISSAGAASAVAKAFTMAVAGQPLHIAYADPNDTIGWGMQGLTIDLEPYFQRDAKTAPLKDFFPVMVDMHRWEGKLFGIPEDLQVQSFFYNQSHFDEAGIPYPDASWTWDTVAKNAARLKRDDNGDGVPERWGMRDPQYLHYWSVFWAFGGELVDNPKRPTKFTGDSLEIQAAFAWFHNMITVEKNMPPINTIKGSTAQHLVGDQTVSMAIGNSLYMQDALKFGTQVRWDVAPMPKGPAGNPAMSNTIGWVIFNNVPNQEEAWEVIKFFSSEEAMRLAVEMRGTLVPHLPTAIYVWPRNFNYPESRMQFVQAVDTSRPMPIVYGSGLTAIRNNFANYTSGKMSLPQALEAMKAGVEAWIATLPK